MKSTEFSWRISILLALCFSLFFLWSVSADVGGVLAATPLPAATQTAPATQATIATDDAEALLDAGFAEAKAGNFEAALEKIAQASKLAPDDERIRNARELLERYVVGWRQIKAERQVEYQAAVEHIRHYMIAQKHLPKLDKELAEKLREKVGEVIEAFNGAGNSELLEDGQPDDVEKLRTRTTKALDESRKRLDEARKILADQQGAYAEMFRASAATLEEKLDACKGAWEVLRTATARQRMDGAGRLRPAESDLSEALIDIESISRESPWKAALVQARLARQLAADKEKLAGEQWFLSFVADVEARGRDAVRNAKWYVALSAYAALVDLIPDKEFYQQSLKAIRRHVRVLGMYGKAPSTQPADNEAVSWKEYVKNVDADMVEKAIQRLNSSYVTAVDFRKLTRGGLTSIEILAETPQATASFPGLKDEQAKARFLHAIDKTLQNIKKRPRVDHLDLQLALNDVLQASERTVQIPTEVLAVEFTDGFLNELDRFSSMIWPKSVPDFRKQTMGNFTGVGIQISKEPGESLKVVTPLADSPAYRAGIKTGDIILEVDGKTTKDMNLEKLVDRIMGKLGTKVVLRIKRQGLLSPIDIPIIRDKINIVTVKGWHRQPGTGQWNFTLDADGSIGYLRITQFTNKTDDGVSEAMTKLRQAGVRSLVVDLRFNPGGLLREATVLSNQFLRAGCRIVSTKGRQTRTVERNANKNGKYLDGDLVVLINEYSASAAEIVSGAVKDWKRGIIVGQRSYGKGSVQNVIPIPGHEAFLKLTTAYYYLPSGRLLHKKNGAKDWGVSPDVPIFTTYKQSKRWVDIRRKTDLLQDIDEGRLAEDLAEQFQADIQLRTAVLLLQLQRLKVSKPTALAG